MIKATNLTKIYKTGLVTLKAIDNINLEIKKGELISITGKSGSGKSTLLYQLGLLDKPTSGEIFINNIDTSKFTNTERTKFRLENLGYIFQDYALLPNLTALENVLTPLYMLGFNYNKASKIASDALIKVGLADKLNNLPNQLSGGQQQRVSIARAVANKPSILFADEPTANLDSETSQTILKVIKDLNSKNLTVVMITHEKEYAKIADKIYVMKDGVLSISK